MAEPAECPTLCDEGCGEACHEAHVVSWRRGHRPDDCPAFQHARHWLWGAPLLRVPLPDPLPSIEETMQRVINDLGERGIRLVVPGFDTPPARPRVDAVPGLPDGVWVYSQNVEEVGKA